jgi:hypothetical protein
MKKVKGVSFRHQRLVVGASEDENGGDKNQVDENQVDKNEKGENERGGNDGALIDRVRDSDESSDLSSDLSEMDEEEIQESTAQLRRYWNAMNPDWRNIPVSEYLPTPPRHDDGGSSASRE